VGNTHFISSQGVSRKGIQNASGFRQATRLSSFCGTGTTSNRITNVYLFLQQFTWDLDHNSSTNTSLDDQERKKARDCTMSTETTISTHLSGKTEQQDNTNHASGCTEPRLAQGKAERIDLLIGLCLLGTQGQITLAHYIQTKRAQKWQKGNTHV
jgi:hypothetical protein